jgi:hypothetical protein
MAEARTGNRDSRAGGGVQRQEPERVQIASPFGREPAPGLRSARGREAPGEGSAVEPDDRCELTILTRSVEVARPVAEIGVGFGVPAPPTVMAGPCPGHLCQHCAAIDGRHKGGHDGGEDGASMFPPRWLPAGARGLLRK